MALDFVATLDYTALTRSTEAMRREISQTVRAIESMGNDTTSVMKQMQEMGDGVISTLKNIGAVAGVTFSVAQAKAFVDKITEVRGYFQDIESSMKVFLGNEKKAQEFTSQLKDYAWYNMFEFSDLATASKQMIAYGHNVESVIPRLDQLSNVARGTSAPLMEMVNAYNRAKNIGYLDTRALQSWAAKGLVVKDVLREMGEQVKNNRVTFEQLNKVLDHVTGEGGMFHNLMGEQLNNITAEQGQLEDNLTNMFNEIGEKYQDVITGTIKAESWLVDHYKEIATVIWDVIRAYGAYRAAIMLTNAVRTAKQTYLYNEEKEQLDALIKDYKEKLPVQQASTNADLAEAVAKKQLTEAQAASIAAKRDELSQLKVESETLGINERLNALQVRKLDYDLQEKVRTEQLTYAQAEQIQQKRVQLIQMEQEIQLLKEKATLNVEGKINSLNERKSGYDNQVNRLTQSKQKDEGRLAKLDKQLQSNPNISERLRNEGLKERETILQRIKNEESEILRISNEKSGIELQLRDALIEQQEVRVKYGDDDEKIEALELIETFEKQKLDIYEQQKKYLKDFKGIEVENVEAARKGVEATQEQLKSIQEKIRLEKQANEERKNRGEEEVDLTPLLEEEAVAKENLSLQTQALSTAEGIETTQKNLEGVATQKETIAETGNVAVKLESTVAIRNLTLQERLHAISANISATATKIFSAAILQARNAIKALGVAITTNPLGVLIGALTLVIPLIMQFTGGMDEMAEAQENMTNAAHEAERSVKAQIGTLKVMSPASSEYKKTLRELTSTYEEYGIELEKTKDSHGNEIVTVEELTKKHEQLIEVLKQEAIERQLNQNVKDAYKEYGDAVDKVKDKMAEAMSSGRNAISETDAEAIINVISDEQIQALGKAWQAHKEATNPEEGAKAWEAYRKAVADVNSVVEKYGKSSGLTEVQIKKMGTTIENFGKKFAEPVKALNDTIDANERAAESSKKATNAQSENAQKIRYAAMSASKLKDELASIVQRFKNTKINVNIVYDEQNKPAWMKSMEKLSDKDLNKKAALYTLAAGKAADKNAKFVKVGDEVLTAQEAYSRAEWAASEKQTREDRAAQAEAERRRTEEEAQKSATARRKKAIENERKQREDERKQRIQTENTEKQAEIAAIVDDEERERATRAEQHRLNLQQIEQQGEEMKKKNLEAQRAAWETQYHDKDSLFEDTQAYKDYMAGRTPLTEDQQRELRAKVSAENTRYIREELESTKEFATVQEEKAKKTASLEASVVDIEKLISKEKERGAEADEKVLDMLNQRLGLARVLLQISKADNDELEYLINNGDRATREEALRTSYGNQIAEANEKGDTYKAFQLQDQLDSEISKLKFDDLKDKVNWEFLFSNLDNVTMSRLQELKKTLTEFINSPEFKTADEQVRRSAFEGLANLNNSIINRGGFFGSLGVARDARNDAITRLQTAETEEVYARNRLSFLKDNKYSSKADIDKASADLKSAEDNRKLAQKGVDTATKDYKDARNNSVNNLAKGFDTLRGALSPVESLFNQLGDSTIAETFDAVGNSLSAATSTFDSFNQLQGLFKEDSAIGKALGSAGPYAAAAAAGISLASSLFGGGNQAEMDASIQRLTDSNNTLAMVIEDLEETIKDSTLYDAMEKAEDLEQLYQQRERNASEQMIAEAQKRNSGRSSLNYSVGDNAGWQAAMRQVSTILNKRVESSGDFLSLTANEMKQILEYDNGVLMNAIKSEYRAEGGKGGRSDKLPEMIDSYINEYSDYGKKITNMLNEKLTGITLDSLEGDFESFLSDITSSTADAAKDIESILRKSIVNGLMDNTYNKRLKDWYAKYVKMINDANGNVEAIPKSAWEDLKAEYMDIADDARTERRAIEKNLGISESSQTQSGTNTSVSTMSQEVGNELNGRFTAIQISNESINRQMASAIISLTSITGLLSGQQNGVLTDIRDSIATGTNHLYDMVKINKQMIDDFGDKLNQIANNTSRL